nr:hypothetical protein [Streptomyces sp. SID8354]
MIALAGATAAVWSPFRPWYDGRHGSDVRIEDLFNGLTHSGATLFGSLVLPMAFAGLLTLAGVALRSRLLVTVAGLVVLGFTILWMVRQLQRSGELTAGAHGLGVGVANALGGGALLILGALIMRGRTRRVPAHEYEDEYAYGDAYARYEPPPASWDPAHRPAEWHPEPYGPAPGTPDPTRSRHPVPPPPPSPSQRPTPPVEWGRELRQRNTMPADEEDDRPTLPNRPAAAPDHPTLPDRPNWPDEPEAPDGPGGPSGPKGPEAPDDHRPTGPDRH